MCEQILGFHSFRKTDLDYDEIYMLSTATSLSSFDIAHDATSRKIFVSTRFDKYENALHMGESSIHGIVYCTMNLTIP